MLPSEYESKTQFFHRSISSVFFSFLRPEYHGCQWWLSHLETICFIFLSGLRRPTDDSIILVSREKRNHFVVLANESLCTLIHSTELFIFCYYLSVLRPKCIYIRHEAVWLPDSYTSKHMYVDNVQANAIVVFGVRNWHCIIFLSRCNSFALQRPCLHSVFRTCSSCYSSLNSLPFNVIKQPLNLIKWRESDAAVFHIFLADCHCPLPFHLFTNCDIKSFNLLFWLPIYHSAFTFLCTLLKTLLCTRFKISMKFRCVYHLLPIEENEWKRLWAL